MKVSDIVIGKRYRHENWSKTVYLGCGNPTSPSINKCLVIVKDGDHGDEGSFVGRVVLPPFNGQTDDFWRKFSEVGKSTRDSRGRFVRG